MLLIIPNFENEIEVDMIEVEDAIRIIQESGLLTSYQPVALVDSLGLVLAEDIISTMNMPPFSQSAMDGYAICGDFSSFNVVGEIKAGDVEMYDVNQKEAYRIFTGAMIPRGTTAIAKQEIVERNGDVVSLLEQVKEGTSIRIEGEEIQKGDLILKKGTFITPAAIGLLSSFGIAEVMVYMKPIITVIVTGNELTAVGEKLQPGRIFESNSYTLRAVLKNHGYNVEVKKVKDNFEATKSIIAEAIALSDVVIMTGGISVGDYDFVGKALYDLGVKEAFYKVNQKPGKPIFYGLKDDVKIFGLPGNPAAVLTCFYIYVLPAIRKMAGITPPSLIRRKVQLGHDYNKKGTRSYLLKAKVENDKVFIHKGQSSAMLSSFVDANCLLFLDKDRSEFAAGDDVEVFMLPLTF